MTRTRPNVACITTTYFPASHADVILSRLLGGFDYDPDVNVVSLYTDQVADEDISREKAAEADVPIYPTIRQTIEADGTPVDGIVVIGEHGAYPWTGHRQKMYPRRRFHEETIDAIDDLELAVPVFNDKHFAYDVEDATWIYRQYKRRDLPFFGGSSVPLQDTVPEFDPSALHDVEEIVVAIGGGVESYGFHGMEVLQSLAEQRSGGETGVESIEAFEGCAVWDAADRGDWSEELLEEALEHSRSELPGEPREHVDVPTLFEIRYEDGLKGYVLNLEDYLDDWLYACRTRDGDSITGYYDTGQGRPYRHFDDLTEKIEELIVEGEAPIPPERTLMTTGLIDLSMKALASREQRRTPALGFGYEI